MYPASGQATLVGFLSSTIGVDIQAMPSTRPTPNTNVRVYIIHKHRYGYSVKSSVIYTGLLTFVLGGLQNN